MALGAVLVDRARVLTRQSTGVKVEGTTLMAPTHGAWFKARLFLQESRERDEQGERRKIVQTPQLMFGLRDENGGRLELSGEVEVEVVSVELGSGTYRLLGDPEPIRKKRALLGGLANLERVVERPRSGVT